MCFSSCVSQNYDSITVCGMFQLWCEPSEASNELIVSQSVLCFSVLQFLLEPSAVKNELIFSQFVVCFSSCVSQNYDCITVCGMFQLWCEPSEAKNELIVSQSVLCFSVLQFLWERSAVKNELIFSQSVGCFGSCVSQNYDSITVCGMFQL